MNVVDSSAWLEYFGDATNADFFAPAIEDVENLVVPAVVLFEVFKRICLEREESEALEKIAHMQQGLVVVLDAALALQAAKLSLAYRLPMADSFIFAVAQEFGATLWTQDAHFEGLEGVRYRPRMQKPQT